MDSLNRVKTGSYKPNRNSLLVFVGSCDRSRFNMGDVIVVSTSAGRSGREYPPSVSLLSAPGAGKGEKRKKREP